MERKKKIQIKEMLCTRLLFLSYTVQPINTKLFTKFKILSQVVPEKPMTENCPMQFIGVRDEKITLELYTAKFEKASSNES